MKQIIEPEVDITAIQKLIDKGCIINSISPHTSTIINGYSFVIAYTVVYTPKDKKS